MKINNLRLIAYSLLLALSASKALANEPPNVLVSIKPIHSLVSSVMKGIATPKLLMKSNQSLHHYNLRPSERRSISQADLVFWIGPELEIFLPRGLSSNNKQTKSISLIDTNNIVKLNAVHHTQKVDPHIWLSTNNALAMTDVITHQLIEIDPEHTTQYELNKNKLKEKITALSKTLKAELNESKKPYITFHNATRYFENEFRLKNVASIQSNHESQPSALHIKNIIQIIKDQNIECLFYDYATKPRLVTSLQNQTKIKGYPLDPTGASVQAGENAWFEIMQNTSTNLRACLNQ